MILKFKGVKFLSLISLSQKLFSKEKTGKKKARIKWTV